MAAPSLKASLQANPTSASSDHAPTPSSGNYLDTHRLAATGDLEIHLEIQMKIVSAFLLAGASVGLAAVLLTSASPAFAEPDDNTPGTDSCSGCDVIYGDMATTTGSTDTCMCTVTWSGWEDIAGICPDTNPCTQVSYCAFYACATFSGTDPACTGTKLVYVDAHCGDQNRTDEPCPVGSGTVFVTVSCELCE